MKAIQTLWCGDRKLIESQFWWSHAEYNLMSWALNCMSLKKQFGKVTLYTDSEGARVLIDKLRLPYDEVIVNYDDFNCLTCHWALAKVRTYSLQTEPFLHIDGDIYLPLPLPNNILGGSLIVQNKEYCTDYYGNMIKKFLAVDNLKISPLFEKTLRNGNIPSCNLGFCGGNDIEFFGKFCDEVFRFFRDNDFNGDRFRHCDISANVVYEQIFFTIMAHNARLDIATVFPATVRDNGYTQKDFCDLEHYEQKQFIHILGGHKRTRAICNAVEQTLLREHPNLYERVAALFPERHKRLFGITVCMPSDTHSNNAEHYDDFLASCNKEWQILCKNELMSVATNATRYMKFANATKNKRNAQIMKRNPYARIYHASGAEADELCKRFNIKGKAKNIDIVVIPTISDNGYAEFPIDNTMFNILTLLKSAKTFLRLKQQLLPYIDSATSESDATVCIEKAVCFALRSGMILLAT